MMHQSPHTSHEAVGVIIIREIGIIREIRILGIIGIIGIL